MTALPPSDSVDPRERLAAQRYWASNRRLVLVLLFFWAFVSLGCGVAFADWLNQWSIGGCPLGFWFAQQGAIVAFVLLVLAYAVLMARLDRRHRRELEAIRADRSQESAP